ncbi:major facilitator superfamily domain-containing protein [Exophiala viscosa]|uniref:Major facilitator superfamily domain-containing protein n=1 Tax=Exophiala viscosa TaxID=2486360 RepID=A0AAN6IIW1_9EURO|nr:major facilitator superfamily domain-containing protein [Exophiala viscosa]
MEVAGPTIKDNALTNVKPSFETNPKLRNPADVQVGNVVDYTEAEEKAVRRKIDLLLMPAIWIMYLFSYADRTNIGNAKVAGMSADLNLSSNEYSLALVVFFISYIIFEIPSNLIIAKTRPSIYLCSVMAIWGVITCCMAAVKSSGSLMAVRFVLGILEAAFAPGVSLMLGCWYKKNEQSRRFGIFYSAAVLSGAFGGIVSGAITGHLDGAHGIAGWRWLFIVEGAATIGCSLITVWILPDFPATSRGFTPRQREIATQRLLADDIVTYTEDTPPLSALEAVKASLQDFRTWLLTLGYICIATSGTMSYFYPTLVKGLGYTSVTAQYMTVPIYSVAFVAVLSTAYMSDKFPSVRGLIIAGWLVVATVMAILTCAIYNYTARYVLLVFLASGVMSANAMSLAFSSSTFAPMRPETRGVGMAFINSLANFAGIYGAYLFPSKDAPKYLVGFGVVSGMCALGATTYAISHILFRRYPN